MSSRRRQLAFLECRNSRCTPDGSIHPEWFNDSGNREWFFYEGDDSRNWYCPDCREHGTVYPY
jgi:hypothetical protein